jgi:hypothetical protein
MQIDEARANDFPCSIDDFINGLSFISANRFDRVAFDDYRAVRNHFVAGAGPAHHDAAVDANFHCQFPLLVKEMLFGSGLDYRCVILFAV